MTMQKVANFMANAKTIWGVVLLFISVAVWAADGRYLQIADGGKIAAQIKLDSLQQGIEELTVQKSFEIDQRKKDMLEALINIKKSKMDALVKSRAIE